MGQKGCRVEAVQRGRGNGKMNWRRWPGESVFEWTGYHNRLDQRGTRESEKDIRRMVHLRQELITFLGHFSFRKHQKKHHTLSRPANIS